MRATIIIASLFAALTVAAPVDVEAPAVDGIEFEARQVVRTPSLLLHIL